MSLKSSFTIDKVEAGIDEVGRGCLAGPVVAAAVVLPKDYTHKVLTDSKKLSRTVMNELVIDIKREALAYAVSEISHLRIDEINILNATYEAMHKAVSHLDIKPELLLVDGNRFKPYEGIAHECVIKGDGKFLSIAAASVLAKVHRDELMESLHQEFPHYGWDTNVGYPTKKHREGIKEHGVSEHHRLSFSLLPTQTELFS